MTNRNRWLGVFLSISSGLLFLSGCEPPEGRELLPADATLEASIAVVSGQNYLPEKNGYRECGGYLEQMMSCTYEKESRFALVSIQSRYPDTVERSRPPRIEAKVDIGWLRDTNEDCKVVEGASFDRNKSFVLDSSKSRLLKWCFGDDGGLGTISLSSGSIARSFQMPEALPAIPYAIYLWPQQDSVARKSSIELTATVLGCDAIPIANASITIKKVAGVSIVPVDDSGTVTTDTNGMAKLIATIAEDYADDAVKFSIYPSSTSWLKCTKEISIDNEM